MPHPKACRRPCSPARRRCRRQGRPKSASCTTANTWPSWPRPAPARSSSRPEHAARVPPGTTALVVARSPGGLGPCPQPCSIRPTPLCPSVHASAVIDPAASVDASAEIGPLAVIGAGAEDRSGMPHRPGRGDRRRRGDGRAVPRGAARQHQPRHPGRACSMSIPARGSAQEGFGPSP